VQIPTWVGAFIDMEKAATSKAYADDLRATADKHGIVITDLASHIIGQLIAVHPAFDTMSDGFAPASVHGNPGARLEWATQHLKWAAAASKNLGIAAHATFSGSLAWPYVYPFPQRPAGLIEEAFDELARRWTPILDEFDRQGVDVCYEIHPSEDLHDGVTYEMFLERVKGHKRANLLYDPSHFILQQLDYLDYIDIYHERIRMFHVKDAEFNPTGRQGVYGGYQSWVNRAGRFRSLGDGQVDFAAIFQSSASTGLTAGRCSNGSAPSSPPSRALQRGAPFIASHIINVTEKAFDDFAATGMDKAANRRILGLDR